MVLVVTGEQTSTLDLAPSELGEALSSMRLCLPQAQQQMRQSLSRLGQLTPVQAYGWAARLELFDGLKRLRAARAAVVAEVAGRGARARCGRAPRCGCCAATPATGLSELEEAWLVRSLYREDRLSQPQIAVLLARHKSWVCRRLALAESLSDELSANVRLGLVSATAAVELARLQRCNQDAVMRGGHPAGADDAADRAAGADAACGSARAVARAARAGVGTTDAPPAPKGGAARGARRASNWWPTPGR